MVVVVVVIRISQECRRRRLFLCMIWCLSICLRPDKIESRRNLPKQQMKCHLFWARNLLQIRRIDGEREASYGWQKRSSFECKILREICLRFCFKIQFYESNLIYKWYFNACEISKIGLGKDTFSYLEILFCQRIALIARHTIPKPYNTKFTENIQDSP